MTDDSRVIGDWWFIWSYAYRCFNCYKM